MERRRRGAGDRHAAVFGSRASGASTTSCRSSAWTSTPRRSTASAAPPAPLLGRRRRRCCAPCWPPCRRITDARDRARTWRRCSAGSPNAWRGMEPQMGFLRAHPRRAARGRHLVEDVTQVGFVGRLAFPVPAPRPLFSPGYQDTSAGATARRSACRRRCPAAQWCCDLRRWRVHVPGGGTRHRHAPQAAAWSRWCSTTARSATCGASRQEHYGNRLIACDLVNPDFVEFAESFGAKRSAPATGQPAGGACARPWRRGRRRWCM